MKYRPPLGPYKPSDRDCTVEIGLEIPRIHYAGGEASARATAVTRRSSGETATSGVHPWVPINRQIGLVRLRLATKLQKETPPVLLVLPRSPPPCAPAPPSARGSASLDDALTGPLASVAPRHQRRIPMPQTLVLDFDGGKCIQAVPAGVGKLFTVDVKPRDSCQSWRNFILGSV